MIATRRGSPGLVRSERLSPREFLHLDHSLVQSARIEPARPGGGGFGTILVTYRTPRYRDIHGRPRIPGRG